MAGEYGLLTQVDIRGHFLTIRFTKAPAICPETPSAGPSLFERVRARFLSRREPVIEQETAVLRDEETELAEAPS
jgi:hypothetical protein